MLKNLKSQDAVNQKEPNHLPQEDTENQYISDGKTATYNYTFIALIPEDIAVYVTLPGDVANPNKDRRVLNQDYTVTISTTVKGGTITFLPNKIPIADSIITLDLDMPVTIETEFGNAQSFNGHTLDAAFQRMILIMRQFNTRLLRNCLQYVINSYLPNNLSNQLPVLTTQDNQVWVSQGGNIIAAQIENTDVSTLRSELASQAPSGGDGTSLIGYYETLEKKGQTLQAYLNQLEQKIAVLTEASIQTGDFIFTGVHITERKGFLLMDGRAISRTDYANLFAEIGTEFGAGDGKTTFNIPKFARRTLVGAGGTASDVLGNTVGSSGGEEVHTMTIDELVSHTHNSLNGNFISTEEATGMLISREFTSFATYPTTAATGNSKPFNVMQPSLVVNGFIKT